jgi:hypothetical protein
LYLFSDSSFSTWCEVWTQELNRKYTDISLKFFDENWSHIGGHWKFAEQRHFVHVLTVSLSCQKRKGLLRLLLLKIASVLCGCGRSSWAQQYFWAAPNKLQINNLVSFLLSRNLTLEHLLINKKKKIKKIIEQLSGTPRSRKFVGNWLLSSRHQW